MYISRRRLSFSRSICESYNNTEGYPKIYFHPLENQLWDFIELKFLALSLTLALSTENDLPRENLTLSCSKNLLRAFKSRYSTKLSACQHEKILKCYYFSQNGRQPTAGNIEINNRTKVFSHPCLPLWSDCYLNL